MKLSKNNPLREISLSSIQHLSSSHIDYVFHWLGLLKLEESEGNKGRFATVSDIWLMNVENRYILIFSQVKINISSFDLQMNMLFSTDGIVDFVSHG